MRPYERHRSWSCAYVLLCPVHVVLRTAACICVCCPICMLSCMYAAMCMLLYKHRRWFSAFPHAVTVVIRAAGYTDCLSNSHCILLGLRSPYESLWSLCSGSHPCSTIHVAASRSHSCPPEISSVRVCCCCCTAAVDRHLQWKNTSLLLRST